MNLKNFKKLGTHLLAFIFLFYNISNANATIYYIKNSGNDSATGLSDAEAWANIGKINSFNFADGDIIRFKRGDSFTDANLLLTNTTTATVKTVTIEDYATGALPIVTGSTRYINISKDNNLSMVIRNIDVSGQNMGSHQGAALELRYLKNVIIDGVYADGSVDFVDRGYGGNTAISVRNSVGDVLIQNCKIFNWGPDGLWGDPPSPDGKINRPGIAVYPKNNGTLTIKNNKIHNIASDGIILENVRVPLEISGNEIWNCGENAVDLKGVGGKGYTSVVKNNKFYRDPTFTGISGSSWQEKPQALLQMLNWSSGPTAFVEIYNNEFGPTDGLNFSIGTTGGGGIANSADINNNIIFRNNYCKKARIHFRSNNGTGEKNQLAFSQINDNWFEGLHDDGLFVRILNKNENATQFTRNFFISKEPIITEEISAGYINLRHSRSKWNSNVFHVNSSSDPTIMVEYADANPSFENNFYYNYHPNPSEVINFKSQKYFVEDQDLWIAQGNINEKFSKIPFDFSPPKSLTAPKNFKIK